VDGSLQAFAARAETRGVRLKVQAEDIVVSVDRTRIRQALDNLLDNALRHTPPGGTVTVAATTSDANTLIVTVQDTGRGFDTDALDHAFQPFNHPTPSDPGAGLGLAIVDAIAHAHGGSTTAQNLPTGGARVTLTLHAPRAPTAQRSLTH
jgi:signal transduction histidine kinase